MLVAIVASCIVVPAAAPAATTSVPNLARTLRSGDSGAAVKALQRALRAVGLKVTVDGQYGPSTITAVQAFQRSARLQPSGTAGARTREALRNALSGGSVNASGGYDPTRAKQRRRSLGDRIPLRRGMSGHDVKVLQDFLRRAGQKVSLDGQFGKGTWRAQRRFEAAQKRAVDGVVDAGDIDALRQSVTGDAGSAGPAQPLKLAPGDRAKVGSDGLAIAPASAPDPVKAIIAAGNEIAKKPYVYGGGHGKWIDSGYDCSGSVSYALHGAGLLKTAMPSGSFMNWGDSGPGQWVTIYTKSSHMFMVVAGLRFDTSGRSTAGTRWQADMRSAAGYVVRHPPGL